MSSKRTVRDSQLPEPVSPIDIPQKIRTAEQESLLLRSLRRLGGNDTILTPAAAGETLLTWEASQACYVVCIIMGGTVTDCKQINLNNQPFAHITHVATESIVFHTRGARPYLFKMKKGDKITIVMTVAAAGNHRADLLGFYEDPTL